MLDRLNPVARAKTTTGLKWSGNSRINDCASSFVSHRIRLFFGTGHLIFGALAIHRHSLAAHLSKARMKARCVVLVACAAGFSLYSGTGLPILRQLSRRDSQLSLCFLFTIPLAADRILSSVISDRSIPRKCISQNPIRLLSSSRLFLCCFSFSQRTHASSKVCALYSPILSTRHASAFS